MLAFHTPRSENFGEWLHLWHGYLRFYNAEVAPEICRLTFDRLLNPDTPMHAVLAVRDNKAIGLVHWIYHPSTWTAGNYCYLQDLYVAPAARGRGAGKALINHVYEHAKQQSASRVYWLTHHTNEAAIRLYDQMACNAGFIQYRKDL